VFPVSIDIIAFMSKYPMEIGAVGDSMDLQCQIYMYVNINPGYGKQAQIRPLWDLKHIPVFT